MFKLYKVYSINKSLTLLIMRFIYWIFLFISIIFLIYCSRSKISPERYYQYNDARSLSNYAVIICFTDGYNDYRSKTLKNKYTCLKALEFKNMLNFIFGKVSQTIENQKNPNKTK